MLTVLFENLVITMMVNTYLVNGNTHYPLNDAVAFCDDDLIIESEGSWPPFKKKSSGGNLTEVCTSYVFSARICCRKIKVIYSAILSNC